MLNINNHKFSREILGLTLLILLLLIPLKLKSSTPQSNPQVYDLIGPNKEQIVILLGYGKDNMVTSYDGYGKDTPKYFSSGQKVWILCNGKVFTNTISEITRGGWEGGAASIYVTKKPDCSHDIRLMSNYNFPEKKWREEKPEGNIVEAIKSKLKTNNNLKITKIVSYGEGIFYLVHDPKIESGYSEGGYRLFNNNLQQISIHNSAPLIPIIDLNNDTFPEFYYPSTDGDDAWIIQMFPEYDQELSHNAKYWKKRRGQIDSN